MADQNLTVFQKLTKMFGYPGQTKVDKTPSFNFSKDELLKTDIDQPSIGIVLCKSKDNLDVEYALRDINKPLGISEFKFNELPNNLKTNLPTVEELEKEFKYLENKFQDLP